MLKSYKILKVKSDKIKSVNIENEAGKTKVQYQINTVDWENGEYESSLIRINESFNAETIRILSKKEYKKDMILENLLLVEFNTKANAKRKSQKGIYLDGQHYMFFNSSPSWIKQQCIMFIKEDGKTKIKTEMLISLTKYKDSQKNNVKLSKEDARYSLGWTGAKRINNTPKFIVVDNPKNIVTEKCYYTKEKEASRVYTNGQLTKINYEKEVHKGEQTIENDLFDGCGVCSFKYAKTIADNLGLKYTPCWFGVRMYGMAVKGVIINFNIHKWFEENEITHIKDIWGNLQSVKNVDMIINGSMAKWHNKFSNMEEYLEKVKDFEQHEKIEGIWKQIDSLWIVKHEEKLNTYTRANYQLLGNLALNKEDILDLADQTKKHYMGIYKNDYEKTMIFLGNINNEDVLDEESEHTLEESLTSKLTTVLATQPKMLDDEYVKESLRRMLQKKIEQIGYGKIYLKGNFKTAIQDPVMFMQYISNIHTKELENEEEKVIIMTDKAGCLNKYEVSVDDGENGDIRTICRHPLNCFLEIKNVTVRKNKLYNKWLSHMKNCIIFNGKDCLVNICSGEDFDLDMNFVIDDEVIRNSVIEGLPIINVDDGKRKPTEGVFTTKNRVITITNSFGNLIGKLSNYGATNSAFGNASNGEDTREKIKESMMEQLNNLVKLTHYQMEAIDAPKNSYVPTIPKDLKVRVKPYYMKYIAKHKGYELHEKKQVKMPCALNQLCWDMEHFYNSIKWDFGDEDINRNIANEFIIDYKELKTTEDIKDLVEKVEDILKEYYKQEQKINTWAKKYKEEIKKDETIENKDPLLKTVTEKKKLGLKIKQEETKGSLEELNIKDTILASIIAYLVYIKHPNRSKNPLWVYAFEGLIKNLQKTNNGYTYSFIRDKNGQVNYLEDRYCKIATPNTYITEGHIKEINEKETSKKGKIINFATRIGKFTDITGEEVAKEIITKEYVLKVIEEDKTKVVGLVDNNGEVIGSIFWDKGLIDEFTHISDWEGYKVKLDVTKINNKSLGVVINSI
ncbi:RNA dependent RNA polymerase [Clostridium botulinum]